MAVALLAATACTGDAGGRATASAPVAVGTADFADAYVEATEAFEREAETVSTAARAALDGEGTVAEAYAGFRDATATARERFAALDAPADLDAGLAALVDALDGLTASLTTVVDLGDGEDAAATRSALADVATALVAVGDARTDIEQDLQTDSAAG